MKPEDVRTSYDGIRPDFHVLRKKAGGFFGYGEHTGSVGVVTVNLPRIAYQSKDEKRVLCPAGPDDGPGCPFPEH